MQVPFTCAQVKTIMKTSDNVCNSWTEETHHLELLYHSFENEMNRSGSGSMHLLSQEMPWSGFSSQRTGRNLPLPSWTSSAEQRHSEMKDLWPVSILQWLFPWDTYSCRNLRWLVDNFQHALLKHFPDLQCYEMDFGEDHPVWRELCQCPGQKWGTKNEYAVAEQEHLYYLLFHTSIQQSLPLWKQNTPIWSSWKGSIVHCWDAPLLSSKGKTVLKKRRWNGPSYQQGRNDGCPIHPLVKSS